MERDASAEYKKRPITDMERALLIQKTRDICIRFGTLTQDTPLSPTLLQAHFALDGTYMTLSVPIHQPSFGATPNEAETDTLTAPRAFIEIATPLGGMEHQYWNVEKYATTSDIVDRPSYSEHLYSEESNGQGAWTHFVPQYVYAATQGLAGAVRPLSEAERSHIKERTLFTHERYETVMGRISKLQAANVEPEMSEIIRRSNSGGSTLRPMHTY